MGLSESKVIINTLSVACRNAENTGRIDVAALLSKNEFIDSLREAWTYIPQKTRRSIGRQRKRTSQGRTRARQRKPASSKIIISPDLMAGLSSWSDNPWSFFLDESIQLNPENSLIAETYLCLKKLDHRGEVDIIRSRLIKIAFYRLKEKLGKTYLRSNDVDDIARIILRSGLVQDDDDGVRSNIVRWIEQGGRLDALCRSIGVSSIDEVSHLGNLFCLPVDCSDEFIRLLPYTGKDRDEEIQRLKDRGILDVQSRTSWDRLAVKLFGVIWEGVSASIKDIIAQSPESGLGRTLQHSQCFRIGAQPSRGVVQPGLRTNEESSHIPHEVESIHSDRVSLLATNDFATTIQTSPTTTSARPQEPSDRPFDNVTNPMGAIDPLSLHNIGDIVNIHDMLQPILSMQDHESFDEQAPNNMANMVNLHDMIQPLLPAYTFAPSDEHVHGNIGNVDIHDMLQPILSVQDCDSHGEPPINMGNTVNVREMIQPLLPAQAFTSSNMHPTSNAVEINGLHRTFQPASAAQPPRPSARQMPTQSRFYVPGMTGSQSMHDLNASYNSFIQPVSAS